MAAKSIVVELSWKEVAKAAHFGTDRMVWATEQRMKNAQGMPDADEWECEIYGAVGEYAVARQFDKFWNGTVGKLKEKDVGGWQVRATKHDHGRLLIYPHDEVDDPFILVTGKWPVLTIRGFMYARDCKKEVFYTDPQKGRFNYFVPQRLMIDCDELPNR